jgi:multidrug efflux pump subunit AcrB
LHASQRHVFDQRLIGDDPDVATYTTYVGQGSPRFWIGLNPILPNANFAQIVIVTKDLEARERVKARLENAIADGALSQARIRVDRFVFGPPVGFPVQFRVVGPAPLKVRAIAEDVRKVMAGNSNVVDPHLGLDPVADPDGHHCGRHRDQVAQDRRGAHRARR